MTPEFVLLTVLTMMQITFLLCPFRKRQKQCEFKGENEELLKMRRMFDAIKGRLDQAEMRARIAEKMAQRSFDLASVSASAMSVLQHRLAHRPLPRAKQDTLRDQVARKRIGDLLGHDEYEWLRPILSDSELAVLDESLKNQQYVNGKAHE